MSLEADIQQTKFKSEYNKLLVNLIYTGNWINQIEASIFKPHSITSPQYNVLRILRGQYPQPATINLIIERMLDRQSNASRIVDRLEQKGLVIRKQSAEDRRAVDVLISDQGLELLATLDEKLEAWEQGHNHFEEQDLKQVNDFLDRFRQNGQPE